MRCEKKRKEKKRKEKKEMTARAIEYWVPTTPWY
jgi:hypothetical protein